MAIWFAMLLLAAAVALFVAAPLAEVSSVRRAGPQDDSARLEHERGLALAAILELEFDHAMGKIADAEFAALRAGLETRALTAMQALAGARKRTSRGAPEHASSTR